MILDGHDVGRLKYIINILLLCNFQIIIAIIKPMILDGHLQYNIMVDH